MLPIYSVCVDVSCTCYNSVHFVSSHFSQLHAFWYCEVVTNQFEILLRACVNCMLCGLLVCFGDFFWCSRRCCVYCQMNRKCLCWITAVTEPMTIVHQQQQQQWQWCFRPAQTDHKLHQCHWTLHHQLITEAPRQMQWPLLRTSALSAPTVLQVSLMST